MSSNEQKKRKPSAGSRDRISSTAGADDIRCPWFKGHNSRKVVCRGPVEHSNYAIEFRYPKDKKKHQEIFCEGKYENCEVCMIIEYMLDDE